MILDGELIFADRQAVTAAAPGAQVVDLLTEGDAVGQELNLKAVMNESAVAAAGTTMKVALQTSEDKVTWRDLIVSGPIPLAEMIAGQTVFDVRVPGRAKRYLRIYFTPSANLTGGKVTAFLTKQL